MAAKIIDYLFGYIIYKTKKGYFAKDGTDGVIVYYNKALKEVRYYCKDNPKPIKFSISPPGA